MSLDLILLHLTLEEGEADVSLRCRDGAVAGHRLVLAALSPMLCRAFRELGGDEEKVCIQLPDFTTEQVNLSTKFHMSTGKFINNTPGGGRFVKKTSRKYNFPLIKNNLRHYFYFLPVRVSNILKF